ncbi:protein spitz-like [Bradysia coprophila]|uniref:protein spitz-like n=1 Tax=Bradysia coprophila TaxID=38358 RepID=UPI00187D8D83|nr:protein spitz-like [Bradysia coprophila]
MEVNCRHSMLFQRISNMETTVESMTTGFYKFLARFSGRRRNPREKLNKLVSYASVFLLLTFLGSTDACSSRTTPKPRPPTPTPRPNITFHTYKCPPAYAAWYCLNDATCFTVKIGDSLLYNCECADGYMGPRCEYKDLDGSYLPTRPRVMLETASIASGATLALFLVLILCLVFYVRWHQAHKKDRLAREENGNGVDTVDGLHTVRSDQPLRPFGPHHQKIIPMAEALKR